MRLAARHRTSSLTGERSVQSVTANTPLRTGCQSAFVSFAFAHTSPAVLATAESRHCLRRFGTFYRLYLAFRGNPVWLTISTLSCLTLGAISLLLLDERNSLFKVNNVLFSQDVGMLGGGAAVSAWRAPVVLCGVTPPVVVRF